MSQIVMSGAYTLQDSGGLSLSAEAMKQLGWKLGDCQLGQHVDLRNERVVLVKHLETVKPSHRRIEGLLPLLRTFPVSHRGYVTIDKGARERFGWRGGMRFSQTVDLEMRGIIVEKLKETPN